MGSTILKIAIFVIAVVSGAIFFFAKPDSTEPGTTLAAKTVSNATQPAAQLTTPQPQPAPTFRWDNSDDLPADNGPPEAPTSDFGFGADEGGQDEDDQAIASFDSNSFDADSEVTPLTEDSLTVTDSSNLNESSFNDSEDIEPPAAPEQDGDFAEESTLLSDNDTTPEQDFASESNSLENVPLENESLQADSLESDALGNDSSDSEAFSFDEPDGEVDSFASDDLPDDADQKTVSPAEPDSTPRMSDMGDTTDLNSDQFSNTENSGVDDSESSFESTSELLEEPQDTPVAAEPTETTASDLQLDSQTSNSLATDTSLPNEIATNEIAQPQPAQSDSQTLTDGPTHRIAMEQDAVLGRSGIVDNDSLSGAPVNQPSAVPVPTPVDQANPVFIDLPATTEPVEAGTEVVDTASQFSGGCFQSDIEEFGSQLFWPSTSKLITETDGSALVPSADVPFNQPISQPADQAASQPTNDELIKFGPQEPGIIFDTDTSADCAQSPAPTMSNEPDTSTPLLAPAPATSPAPTEWSPCSPESAPRVRYIWVIPKCECKKPPKCCGK